jgi:hypothetical protein
MVRVVAEMIEDGIALGCNSIERLGSVNLYPGRRRCGRLPPRLRGEHVDLCLFGDQGQDLRGVVCDAGRDRRKG